MRKIIFLAHIPLTRNYKRYLAIDSLLAAGARVEYWDLSALYFKNISLPDTLEGPGVVKFSSGAELEAAIAAVSREAVFITIMTFEPRLLGLMRKLTVHGAILGHMAVGMVPWPAPGAAGKLRRALDFIAHPSLFSTWLKYRACAALRRAGYIKNYDVVFAAGGAAADAFRGQAGSIIPINHYDYDEYLRDSAPAAPGPGGKYAVFLDENLAAHPDLKMLGVPYIDGGRYYSALNAFFEMLERRYSVEVVIAAHPKSDYVTNPYGGRRIVKYATRMLVKGAEFVFATASTSSGFAAMYEKPIFFITTEDIAVKYKEQKYDVLPYEFAAAFGTFCVKLDGADLSSFALPSADPVKAREYRYRYLTSRETERTTNEAALLAFASARRATA